MESWELYKFRSSIASEKPRMWPCATNRIKIPLNTYYSATYRETFTVAGLNSELNMEPDPDGLTIEGRKTIVVGQLLQVVCRFDS